MAGVDLREVAERFAAARDLGTVGQITGEACERGLPFGSFGYAVLEPRVSEQPCIVIRSGEYPTEWLARRFPPILLAIERELGGLTAALSEPRAYDGFVKFPIETLKDTELLNDHWRPIHCDQQLVAPLWHAGAPVGYFAVVRSAREARFTAADLRFVDEVRTLAERGLGGVTSLGSGDLRGTVEALAQAFPHPAFLFDAAGKLRWMSDEGSVRLGVASAKLGAGQLVSGSAALDALSSLARVLASDPAADADAGLRAQGVLHRSERLAIRRFGESGTSLLLLAFTPAMAGLAGEPRGTLTAALPRLGAVESRVARLAASGRTVLGIAGELAISRATVRTHLHRIYVKLGVHARAELAFALLRGRG